MKQALSFLSLALLMMAVSSQAIAEFNCGETVVEDNLAITYKKLVDNQFRVSVNSGDESSKEDILALFATLQSKQGFQLSFSTVNKNEENDSLKATFILTFGPKAVPSFSSTLNMNPGRGLGFGFGLAPISVDDHRNEVLRKMAAIKGVIVNCEIAQVTGLAGTLPGGGVNNQ